MPPKKTTKAAAPAAAGATPQEAAKVAAPKAAAAKPAAAKPAAAKPAPKDVPAEHDEENEAQSQRARRQITQILGLSISNARCMSHMKHYLISPETEAALSALRPEQKRLKTLIVEGDDSETTKTALAKIKGEIAVINENVVRLGGDAPIAMATICDYMVREFLQHAMQATVAADRKMVEVSYLHTPDVTGLATWPLVRNLPCITGYDPAVEEEIKRTRTEENKHAKEARAEAKKIRAEGGEPAPAAHNLEEGEEDGIKTNFQTYVEHATKELKKEEAFAQLRVSERLRKYVSQMVIELVHRLTRQAQISVRKLLIVRTLNARYLKTVVESIMVDEGSSETDIDDILTTIQDKLDTYATHLGDEATRKMAELDDEKRAELEQKRAAQETERKAARLANAKAAAFAAVAKTKKLTAELEAEGKEVRA